MPPPLTRSPNEEIRLSTHPHWSTLAKPTATAVLIAAVGIAASVLTHLVLVALLAVVIGVAVFGGASLRRRCIWLVVTNRRVAYHSGVVRVTLREIPIGAITDTNFQ